MAVWKLSAAIVIYFVRSHFVIEVSTYERVKKNIFSVKELKPKSMHTSVEEAIVIRSHSTDKRNLNASMQMKIFDKSFSWKIWLV